uniref:Uncharacterized protein n=1 Tax=Anguilla anguilla TaxID=7936 RepID=A0A0E9VX75_ANGAN
MKALVIQLLKSFTRCSLLSGGWFCEESGTDCLYF